MPLPRPRPGESRSDFMSRCMGDSKAREEFPRQGQRAAVCMSQFRSNNEQACADPTSHSIKAHFQSGSYRRETLDGQDYLVVPVVMMVEGVHHGSGGPLLYTAEELAKFPGAWDGRPVPVLHPEVDGANVSCNSPDIIETWTVGQLFNTTFDGAKLRSEAWVNVDKCRRISPETLAMLEAGVPMDVSTGLWSEDEEARGTWHGEAYTAIARNIRPDHLALLPGTQGACSWADGCGVRANNSTEDPMEKQGVGKDQTMLGRVFSALGLGKDGGKPAPANRLTGNEQSYQDISRTLQRMVDAWDGNGQIHFVKAVYDDRFVYEVASEDPSASGLFQQEYSIDGQTGDVELEGGPTKVAEQREYVPVTQNAEPEDNEASANADEAEGEKPATVHNHKEESPMKVNAKIQELAKGLIENEAAPFTEDDRDTLHSFSECTLKALSEQYTAQEDAEAPEAEATAEPQAEAEQAPTGNADGDTITMKVDDLQKMVDNAVDRRVEAERKAELISGLTANGCDIDEGDLGTMSIPALEKLSGVFAPDYSGRGGKRTGDGVVGNASEGPKTYAMPSVVMADDESKQQ